MPERLPRALADTPAAKRTILHAGCGGMRALCSAGSLAWEGEGMAPGYHWRLIGMVFCGCFFCVLVACGVGDYFVAFSLVADSVCELCVVIAGW